MSETAKNDDLARDLRADLVTCDAATAGPWFAWVMMEAQATIAGGERYGNVQGPKRVSVDRSLLFGPEDAIFIAAAREGWPAAIRIALHERARAEKAEALLRRLVEAADKDAANLYTYRNEHEGVIGGLADEARELLEGRA